VGETPSEEARVPLSRERERASQEIRYRKNRLQVGSDHQQRQRVAARELGHGGVHAGNDRSQQLGAARVRAGMIAVAVDDERRPGRLSANAKTRPPRGDNDPPVLRALGGV
jgi:hypothetical protein